MRQEERDRIEYAGYVARRLEEFWIHAPGAFVWKESYSIAKGQVRARLKADSDVFVGPWHAVRPHVTTEFREWIDEYCEERLTFSEWQAAQRHERERERIAREEYEESGDAALDSLDLWRDLAARRDEFIVQARRAGKTYKQLQAATGMSRSALAEVVARADAADAIAVEVPDMIPDDLYPVVMEDGSVEYAF